MNSPNSIVGLVTGTVCDRLRVAESVSVRRLSQATVLKLLQETVLDIEARTNIFISPVIASPDEVEDNFGHVIGSDDGTVGDLVHQVWESGYRHITTTYVPRDDGAVFRGDVIVVDGHEQVVSETDGRIISRVVGWSGHSAEANASVAEPGMFVFCR